MSPPWVRPALWAFLGGISLFRLIYVQTLPLLPDETVYWDWSRHLAAGYYDSGPLVALTIKAGTLLLGETVLGVRLPAVLMALGLSWLLFDFCRRFFNRPQLGFWVVVAANSTLLFSLGGLFHTYDTPQVFFWMLALWLGAAAVFEGRALAWYGAGAAMGLSLLAKYSSLLLPVGLLLFLLTSPQHRPWLRRKEPYLAAAIAAAVFSPNLVWNMTHHWAAFAHVLGQGGGSYRFTTPEFIGAQAALFGPVLFIMFIWGLYRAWRLAWRGKDKQRFLLWTALPTLGLFWAMSAWTGVYANWTAPGYLAALLASAAALAGPLASSRPVRRWAVAGLIAGYLVVAGAHFHTPILRALDLEPENDPTAEIYGWEGIGPVVDQALENWPGQTKPFIFAGRHQLASLIAFYATGQPETTCLYLPGQRLSQYLFWTDPAELAGRDGLAVFKAGSRKVPELRKLFASMELIDEVELKGPLGRVLHRLELYRCLDFKGADARPARFLK